MDEKTARILNEATGEFYRLHARSFSRTRRSAWPGWGRAMGIVSRGLEARDGGGRAPGRPRPLEVLDVACGNLRFEAFLAREMPGRALRCRAVDGCDDLVAGRTDLGDGVEVRYRRMDIVDRLLGGRADFRADDDPDGELPLADLAVCFGFFHHVPGAENRAALLRALVDATAPGGFTVVSFWRFLESPELAARAGEAHRRNVSRLAGARGLDPARLDAGDFLLGWQDDPDACRYCHHFPDGEVDRLASSVGDAASVAGRFEADGRTGALNSYLVLRRHARPSR